MNIGNPLIYSVSFWRWVSGGCYVLLFFSFLKPVVMQYYIIPSSKPGAAKSEFTIMEVKPAEQAAFLTAHGHHVIAKGNSIAEALLAYQQWLNQRPG